MAAFLGEIGRRQIDHDAARRQGEPQRGDRGADPLAALADRLVRQADDRKGDQARDELGLDATGTASIP